MTERQLVKAMFPCFFFYSLLILSHSVDFHSKLDLLERNLWLKEYHKAQTELWKRKKKKQAPILHIYTPIFYFCAKSCYLNSGIRITENESRVTILEMLEMCEAKNFINLQSQEAQQRTFWEEPSQAWRGPGLTINPEHHTSLPFSKASEGESYFHITDSINVCCLGCVCVLWKGCHAFRLW